MGTSSFFDYDKMLRRIPRPLAPRVPQPPRAARHEAECGFLKKEAEPLF